MSAVVGIARNTYLAVIGKPSKWRPGPKQPMRGHKDVVREVAFFKDGRRVVTGSDDRTLRIWDIQGGGLSMVARPLEEHTDRVRSVTVSADDRLIASGGCDKTIIIWDVESKQKVFNPLVGHTDWVRSVSFSPDGKKTCQWVE
jgi:WD40 repeat protein